MIDLSPAGIFNEYLEGVNYKSALGSKGIYEQTDINERFYIGDQWYGAECGNKRPLVRHNIIKRIGEYKLSQILDTRVAFDFGVNGVTSPISGKTANLKKRASGFKYTGDLSNDEIIALCEALKKYFTVTSKRLNFDNLCSKALRNSYISGTGIIYTYWDSDVKTGIQKGYTPVNGDIKCEVLSVKDVYFAKPYEQNTEAQPFIIISSVRDREDVLNEAAKYGADEFTLNTIKNSGEENITVLTKLFKVKNELGEETVMCIKVTEKTTVRSAFDTKLKRYPIAVFRFEERNNSVYGESEVTYVIPNQIAINRMITANVWSAVISGMPMMVVNGDTVTSDITNEPGQIIKIFGSNEDVEGAIKYITPPDITKSFSDGVNTLIENTLTQCGANEIALGDSPADNMGALKIMRNAATMPLDIIKNRYCAFLSEIALIWVDFWITQYGNRKIRISDENGVWYLPFNSERYSNLQFICDVYKTEEKEFTSKDSINLLTSLLEKGIISKEEYLERLPTGLIPNADKLYKIKKEGDNI